MNTSSNGAAETLLQPLGVDNFFNSYWEQSPVHIERSDTTHFANILNIDSLDSLLASSELHFPDVQLIQQPDGIAKDQYVDKDNRVLPLRLIEHYAAGATLTIARADYKIGALGDFCRRLQSEWQMQCHANVYLSPPGHQGFKPHYDTHDVFIVQASGKKQFNFYSNNVELPFNDDAFDSRNFIPGEQTEQITLTAGDTLYIPRGITHDAIALEQSPSLHITVGVYPVTARDLLQELLQLAAEQDTRFRQSIPLVNLTSSSTDQNPSAMLSELLEQLPTTERVKNALSSFRDQTAVQCTQDSSGMLSRQHRPRSVTAQCNVQVKADQVISIDTDAEITTLRLPGQIVEFHQPMGAAVHWLVEQQTTTVRELPLLSAEQKIALIDKLYQLNIVSIK